MWYSTLMTRILEVRLQSRRLGQTLAIAALFAHLVGCEEAPAQAAQGKDAALVAAAPPPVAPQGETGSGGTPPSSAAQTSYEETSFQLKLVGPRTVKVGVDSEFSIELVAGDGFKVNDEYPLKFKFEETSNVVPQSVTVPRDKATISKSRAILPVHLKATAAGKHEAKGRFFFSVCTEERCLIERRDLSLTFEAS